MSKLTQAGLQTLQTKVPTSTTLLQTSLEHCSIITQAELVQPGHTQGEMSSPLGRLRMEPVGSNLSSALCTLVAEPSPETRFTQSSLSQDGAPPQVPTQVRLGCFQRYHRPAGSGQQAVSSLRTPPRPDGISGRPSKPAEAKSCPRGQIMPQRPTGPIRWGWSKVPMNKASQYPPALPASQLHGAQSNRWVRQAQAEAMSQKQGSNLNSHTHTQKPLYKCMRTHIIHTHITHITHAHITHTAHTQHTDIEPIYKCIHTHITNISHMHITRTHRSAYINSCAHTHITHTTHTQKCIYKSMHTHITHTHTSYTHHTHTTHTLYTHVTHTLFPSSTPADSTETTGASVL